MLAMNRQGDWNKINHWWLIDFKSKQLHTHWLLHVLQDVIVWIEQLLPGNVDSFSIGISTRIFIVGITVLYVNQLHSIRDAHDNQMGLVNPSIRCIIPMVIIDAMGVIIPIPIPIFRFIVDMGFTAIRNIPIRASKLWCHCYVSVGFLSHDFTVIMLSQNIYHMFYCSVWVWSCHKNITGLYWIFDSNR